MRKILFIILFLLTTQTCFAAQFLYKTVKPSGGDYTALETCMNANEQDLTGDGWFDVEIDGTWSTADTTAVTIHNYTTTAVDYINIYTTTAARHNGKAVAVSGLSSYRLGVTADYTSGLLIQANYTRIDGLEIWVLTNEVSNDACVGVNSGAADFSLIWITNSIIHPTGTGTRRGIYVRDSTCKINNTIIYNAILYGIYSQKIIADPILYVENTTVIKCVNGIKLGGGTLYCKNTYCGNNTTADYGGSPTLTTAASSDATGTAGLQSILVSTTADATHAGFVNVTATTEDFHIKVGSPLIDVGTDLSADTGWVLGAVDIDGVTRTGTWDIGADEYVATGSLLSNCVINNAVIQ